ncbi:MAG: tRNA (adenosine(37)-N6)-dimethylallyltransferase MiaA [Thiobacillaceae bacterium]
MSATVLVLVGPTATGKSGLAVELAQHYPIEIVSMDSALVYRGMNIGTAKPDVDTLNRIPHHLINLIDPTQRYSAARFVEDARHAVQAVLAHGNVPLLVGGTLLYYTALVDGLDALPQADDRMRARIEADAHAFGWPALHRELALADPLAAVRIGPADAQRIQRALEVLRTTGRPISSFWTKQRDSLMPYRFRALALVPMDRGKLHAQIERRFDQMLGLGFVDEVRTLRETYSLNAGLPSMRSVGYRQVWAYLEGAYDLREMRNRGVFATRQLAKRQLTWLRRLQLESVDCFDAALASKFRDWAGRALT